MNKEGGSTLTIRKSNHVTDGFKGYKATLFAGEMSYTEINIPLRKGDDLFLHGNKDAGCIGYFSGSEVLLFGCYGVVRPDTWRLCHICPSCQTIRYCGTSLSGSRQ